MIKFELVNIDEIIDQLEKIDFDYDKIAGFISGDLETYEINKEYKKVVVKGVSTEIDMVIIDLYNTKMHAISFNGRLSICIKSITENYLDIQENYSVRDNLFFYSFKVFIQNKIYFISFFEPSHNKIDLLGDGYLDNLCIERQ